MIAYLGADLHPDVLETWSLGRHFAWGNPKHPPLMGWVARLWTSVFPLTDWSFQLLAMVNSAFALWAVDLIARRFVRGDKRVIVLLLLMLSPIYQFHAQRFNANSIQLATWPLATYCFLRSFETRRIGWAVATGVLAAFAMLGKYYSVFLVASFILAAVCHPQRRAYLASPAPWVATLSGFIVLAPHIYWLAATGAMPFQYAMQIHGGVAFERSIEEVYMFLLGLAAALTLPALAWVLMAGSRLKAFPTDFRDINSGLLLLLWVLVGTIAFPAITTVAVGTDMPSLWALQGLFLVAVLIVCGASFDLKRLHTINLTAAVIGFALVAVIVAAPMHALYHNTHPFKEGRNFYRLAAHELMRRWHALSDAPLPRISGEDTLAFATAFYGSDHPIYSRPFAKQYDWPIPPPRPFQHGWAAMCFTENETCITWARSIAASNADSVNFEFTVHARVLGRLGATSKILAIMIPPRDNTIPPHTPHGNSADEFSAQRRKTSDF